MSISPVKVRVVAVAQPSRILQLLLLWLAFNSQFLRADDRKVPATQLPSCELLSRGPGVTLQNQDILLHSLLTDLLAELRSDSMSKLASFFHPRAKKTVEIGEKLRILLKNRYTTPWQFSIFRVWRLTVPNASKAIFDNCPESGGASLISQFGYEKQFMVLIQIMGQNELGRLLIAVAPDQGRLYATALRLQQWTQDGEDAESWASKAAAAAKANDSVQAVLAYDVAQKLLSGEDLILFPRQRLLQNDRDAVMTQTELVKKINETLKIKTIAYVGSMLSREGSGLLLRETIEKVEPTTELLERCRNRGLALVQQGWIAKANGGIRCNYIFPGMNPQEDSPMGGLYLTHEDLINSQKK